MTEIDAKDREILTLIAARGEMFFKELEDVNMMARSTLSKHLKALRAENLIAKHISTKRKLGSHDVVYVLTAKGKRAAGVNPFKIEDFF